MDHRNIGGSIAVFNSLYFMEYMYFGFGYAMVMSGLHIVSLHISWAHSKELLYTDNIHTDMIL
jgi:hypothetical protein